MPLQRHITFAKILRFSLFLLVPVTGSVSCKFLTGGSTIFENNAENNSATNQDGELNCGADHVDGVAYLGAETVQELLASNNHSLESTPSSNPIVSSPRNTDPIGGVSNNSENPSFALTTNTTDACQSVCTGIGRNYYGQDDTGRGAWAACFSCRCKAALKEFPTEEQLRCSNADHLALNAPDFTDGRMTGTHVIDPNSRHSSGDCLNGGFATSSCDRQSRFKRMLLNNRRTEFQLLCRKGDTSQNGYREYLLIGHNTENGATCFWQARPAEFDGNNVPNLDLTGANDTAQNRKAYSDALFTLTTPGNCVGCHSADAFIWSPHLSSVWSLSSSRSDDAVERRLSGEYRLVSADQPLPQSLTTRYPQLTDAGQPLERTCGPCHRVAKSAGYCGLAMKSVGLNQVAGFNTPEGLAVAQSHLFFMPPGNRNFDSFRQLQANVQNACRGAAK